MRVRPAEMSRTCVPRPNSFAGASRCSINRGEARMAEAPSSPLEYALAYARVGFAVFPCRPRGKEPITKHGFKDATRDEAQIRKWWTRWPDANIGIATG